MTTGTILDIAHISFLDMIKVLIRTNGPASAKGTLMRNAMNAAGKVPEVDYDTLEDFVKAVDDTTNPITILEGKATHMGEGLFGLQNCPFAASIQNYTNVFETLPEGYDDFTAEFNKPSRVTTELRVGEGAGVSPFCSVHQPMRSAVGDRITIGGKKIAVYQLGCKSGGGRKGLADKWIAETGIPREKVEQILDDHMCCYFVKVQ